MKKDQLSELLPHTLETTTNAVSVYPTAVPYALNTHLKGEWRTSLQQKREQDMTVTGVMEKFGLDPTTEPPGRRTLRHRSTSPVEAMTMALHENHLPAVQLVAAETVETVEPKGHHNWELMVLAANQVQDEAGTVLNEASEHIQNEKGQRLCSSLGWTLGLRLESLGLQVVLPSSSEVKKVKR